MSFIPGLPEVRLDPDLVLPWSSPRCSTRRGCRARRAACARTCGPIGLLAVGLVLFTALVVGVVASWLLPGLPLVSALILGAIVAPPDAVAAASIGRRLGLQRRVMAILEGESLLNDATALTLLRIMLAAAGVGSATPPACSVGSASSCSRPRAASPSARRSAGSCTGSGSGSPTR